MQGLGSTEGVPLGGGPFSEWKGWSTKNEQNVGK